MMVLSDGSSDLGNGVAPSPFVDCLQVAGRDGAGILHQDADDSDVSECLDDMVVKSA